VDSGNGTGGDSAFAAAVKTGRYPQDEFLHGLEQIETAHRQQHQDLREAIDTTKDLHEPRLAEALKGQAGDGQLAQLAANTKLWDQHADLYPRSADAVTNAVGELRNLQGNLGLLIEAREPAYNDAVKRGDSAAADGIVAETHTEADDLVLSHGSAASGHIFAADFTAPIPQSPANGGPKPKEEKKPGEENKRRKLGDPDAPADPLTANSDGGSHDKLGDPSGADNSLGPNGLPGQNGLPGSGRDKLTDPPASPLQNGGPFNGFPSMPFGGAGGSHSGGGGGGLGSGMGSGLGSPGGMGSGLGSAGGMGNGLGASTSPAAAMSPPPAAASASPLSNFQSGLASGMGSSGGAAPAQQPLAPFASQQPAAATSAGQVTPAAAASAPNWAGSADSAGVSGGHGGAAGGSGAGGAVMPPGAGMAGGAQPLAPYSPPGSGAAAGSGGGGGPTAPAGGAGSGQTAPSGGAGPGGGGPGAPPILAGNPGSSAAMSALAGSATEMSADVLTAQRVLGELVRGSEESGVLATWAVSVLRSPFGPQIVVAGSIGGGWYLPATVFLPTTARLAVNDPALPMGWAEDWMGSQFPSKILVDHFERVSNLVGGMAVSAMVTTELWAEQPACVSDFLAMEHKDALQLLHDAPKLDAAHQHRLVVLDSSWAQRVHDLDRGGEVSAWVATQLTETVFAAARQPDDTGLPLVSDADIAMWEAVKANAADGVTWSDYDRDADASDNGASVWPEQYAQTVMWYRHFYRRGRVIELLRCWKNNPPALGEVTYAALLGWFGPVVAPALVAAEQRIGAAR
jgi:hypothetical protein